MQGEPDNLKHELELSTEMPDRRAMIRDVAVFQLKLLADGLRDLLLVPVSLGAAIVSLLKAGPTPGTEFYDLLRLGRRSEHWINLFGAASHLHGPANDAERFPGEDIDDLLSKVESFVIDEYRSGGVTAQAREKLERALEAVRSRSRPRD
jgi:hypothetical protein